MRAGEVKVSAWRRKGSAAGTIEREDDGDVERDSACHVPERTVLANLVGAAVSYDAVRTQDADEAGIATRDVDNILATMLLSCNSQ